MVKRKCLALWSSLCFEIRRHGPLLNGAQSHHVACQEKETSQPKLGHEALLFGFPVTVHSEVQAV